MIQDVFFFSIDSTIRDQTTMHIMVSESLQDALVRREAARGVGLKGWLSTSAMGISSHGGATPIAVGLIRENRKIVKLDNLGGPPFSETSWKPPLPEV